MVATANSSTRTPIYRSSSLLSTTVTYESRTNIDFSKILSFSSLQSIPRTLIEKEKEKKRNLIRLDEYRDLKENWNENGAEPFNNTLIRMCQNIILHLLRQPEIFPTGRQSIQFEYEKDNGDYLEFEIFEEKILLLLDVAGNQHEEVINMSIDEVNEVILKFYGQ